MDVRFLFIGCLLAVSGLGCAASSSAIEQTGGAVKTPDRVQVSGFSCENQYGTDLNQAYVYQGTTRDGRPYYRGATRTDRYLYFDQRCSDDSPSPRWILGGQPALDRTEDLNPHDRGCDNDFSIAKDSRELPTGTLKAVWLWCGDHGYRDQTVTISSD